MACGSTATLDKLDSTDYMDIGNWQEIFAQFSWTENDSKYLDIKLKCSRKKTKKQNFVWDKNFSMGEVDFNQFIRQRNQLVVAADNFLREQNLSPVL